MRSFFCFFFGHKYCLAQNLNSYSRRVCCTRCSQSFAMNDDVNILIEWDSDFHRLYERQGIKIEYLDFEFSKKSPDKGIKQGK